MENGGQTDEERVNELAETTVLSRREAEVYVFKEQGWTHEEIADELGIAKSTVDEYSRRINDRLKRAKMTVRMLADG